MSQGTGDGWQLMDDVGSQVDQDAHVAIQVGEDARMTPVAASHGELQPATFGRAELQQPPGLQGPYSVPAGAGIGSLQAGTGAVAVLPSHLKMHTALVDSTLGALVASGQADVASSPADVAASPADVAPSQAAPSQAAPGTPVLPGSTTAEPVAPAAVADAAAPPRPDGAAAAAGLPPPGVAYMVHGALSDPLMVTNGWILCRAEWTSLIITELRAQRHQFWATIPTRNAYNVPTQGRARQIYWHDHWYWLDLDAATQQNYKEVEPPHAAPGSTRALRFVPLYILATHESSLPIPDNCTFTALFQYEGDPPFRLWEPCSKMVNDVLVAAYRYKGSFGRQQSRNSHES